MKSTNPKDVLRDEPSAKQRVLEVHPMAEAFLFHGYWVTMKRPIDARHFTFGAATEELAWENHAAKLLPKLSPVPPSEGLKEAEETMTETFDKVPDGEWVQPIRKGYRMQCCDCGLIHSANFRIRNGRVQFQMTREPHTLEDVQQRMESRKVTCEGKSWLDWHQHIDALFAKANPGENITWVAPVEATGKAEEIK